MSISTHPVSDKPKVQGRSLARFALDGPVLPLVTDTMPVAGPRV